MSVQLLDKTRKINKLLHNSSSSKVVFNLYYELILYLSNGEEAIWKKINILVFGLILRRTEN